MLLTSVAFMFIVYTMLPPIPYLTYMDWYTIIQFFYMVLVVGLICKPSDWITDDDGLLFQICAFLWLAMHVVIGVIFVYGRHVELNYRFPTESSSTRSKSGPGRLKMTFDDESGHNFNKTFPTFYLDQTLLEEAFEAVDNKFERKEAKQFAKLVDYYESDQPKSKSRMSKNSKTPGVNGEVVPE